MICDKSYRVALNNNLQMHFVWCVKHGFPNECFGLYFCVLTARYYDIA